MVEEDVTDKNRQDKNFRRTNTFRKNKPILLVTFGQVTKYLGKFMFVPPNCFDLLRLWLKVTGLFYLLCF